MANSFDSNSDPGCLSMQLPSELDIEYVNVELHTIKGESPVTVMNNSLMSFKSFVS